MKKRIRTKAERIESFSLTNVNCNAVYSYIISVDAFVCFIATAEIKTPRGGGGGCREIDNINSRKERNCAKIRERCR